MTDDRGNRMSKTPLPEEGEPPRGFPANIFNALDMADVGEIDIAFERPLQYPRPATFD